MDILELMLNEKEENKKIFNKAIKKSNKYIEPQKANKNASIYDLMDMINKLVNIKLKDLNVSFEIDEGKDVVEYPDVALNKNYITYKIISKESLDEFKPRLREIIEKDNCEVYGRKFRTIVQFNIFAMSNKEANILLEEFDSLLFNYTSYFKKNGVIEFLYHKQFTDEHYNSFRQNISIRNVQYIVDTEKLQILLRNRIKEIEQYS